MDMKEFCAKIKDEIPDFLMQYNIENIEIRPQTKNNGVTRTGLNIILENQNVSPCIYMEKYLDKYLKNQNNVDFDFAEDIVKEIAEEYREKLQSIKNVSFDELEEAINPATVFACVVNAEKNRVLLQDVPHRMIEDMAVIYRIKFDVGLGNKEGLNSAIIHNSHMTRLGISEEKLYEWAYENTRQLFPTKIASMYDKMYELLKAEGMPDQFVEMQLGGIPKEDFMYIMSNSMNVFGATSVIYNDDIAKFAEEKGADSLIVLPSSIHEVILLNNDIMTERTALEQIVRDVNQNVLAKEEFLSDNVYCFDVRTRELKLYEEPAIQKNKEMKM